MMKSMVRYEEVASDPTAVWRIVSATNYKAVWENEKTRRSVELRRITLKSTQGKHWMGAPEGNFNPPPTGYYAVPNGWGQNQLPPACLVSPKLNNLNPSHRPELARQCPQYPRELRNQSQFQYQAIQWDLNSGNGSEKDALSAMDKNADSNEVDEIQKDESALKGSDAKTKSNDPTEAPSQPVETNDKAKEMGDGPGEDRVVIRGPEEDNSKMFEAEGETKKVNAEEKKGVNEFGDEDKINKDVDGEEPHTGIIASISNDNPALVSCIEDERLEFQDGDLVVFSEVQGMTELNDGKQRKIINARPYSFCTQEDPSNFGNYAKCDPASSGGAAGNSHGEIESSGNVMIDLPSFDSGSEAQNAKLGSNDSADAAASIVAEKGHNFEPAVREEEKVQAMGAEKSNGEELPLKKSTFSYIDEVKERFNRILKYYVGTHNFHNFTTRTKAEDTAAKGFINSFSADRVVSLDGIDFVRCEVVGQSFMLHQIQKMIGLAVAVLRNCTPESIYDVAFRKDVNLNVPTAPEVGLYLDDCMFTSYNKKWRDSQEAVSMEPYSEEAEEFKIKYILSHIAAMENKEGAIKTDKLLASLACQVKEEDNKRSQVIRIWDPGSESKNMKWGRIETSGHMLSFNVVTEDNVEIVSHQAEAERQLMQISVKIPSVGKNIKLNVKKSNSVVVVKAEIERKVGILMNKQILLYTDRQLEDNQMLSQCDLRNGQTLHVLVCPTDKLCIFVNVRGERIISLDVKCCYTVAEFSRPGVVVKHCKEGKYLYKVCPYKKASQVEGLSSTNLGRWDKFEESYRVMHFSNGDICWNGPDRNLKVRLRCELSNELNDIDEPSRCEYCFGDAAQVDKQLAYTLLLAENICQKHGINLLLIAPVGGRRRPQYTALNVPRECTLLVGWRPKSCTHSQTVVESPGPKSWKNVHFKEPGVILEEVDFCDTHFELILRQGRKLRFCSANLPLSENITVPAHLSDFHLFDLLLPNHVCQILSGPNYDYYSSTMRFTISSLVMSDAVIDYNLLNGKWQIVQQQKHAHTVPLFPHGACFVAASTNRLSSEDFEDRDWNELSEYYACEYYNVPTKDRALISLTLVYSLKHKQEGNPGCFMDMVQSGSTNYVRQNFYMDVEQLQA